ncbi:MAG: hypothetical protein HYT70_00670 [Candidatus Aenigmarchaeota archaeon]|nr:hypothetical protein [Candidatus Aenigmarchaeota archaeon]
MAIVQPRQSIGHISASPLKLIIGATISGIADTVRHAAPTLGELNPTNIEDAFVRYGVPSSIETMGLFAAPLVIEGAVNNFRENASVPGTPAGERYANAFLGMTPRSAYLGAVLNGIGHYFEPDRYQSLLGALNNWPLVGGVVDSYQNLPNYVQRLGDGAIEGAAIGLVPSLLIGAGSAGLYGRAANGIGRGMRSGASAVGRGARALGNRYATAVQRVYNDGATHFRTRYGNPWGRVGGVYFVVLTHEAGIALGVTSAVAGRLFGIV